MTITFATYNLLKGKIKRLDKIMMIRIDHQFNQTSNINYFDKIGGWQFDFHEKQSYIEILARANKFFKTIIKSFI